MTTQERLLLALSKHPDRVNRVTGYAQADGRWTVETALATLLDSFPDFRELIAGQDVLDYGCGDGFQAVAMARLGARSVHGVEIDASRLRNARELAEGTANVTFSPSASGQFDRVLSLNSIEHFPDPAANFREMRDALRPDGMILASFGPPWYSPFGHHMYFFCDVPWINLAFSEKAIFRIRSLYRDDGATGFAPGLNRMSIAKFERLVAETGLRFVRRRYRCVRRWDALGKLPGVREMAINQVDALLARQ